MEDLKIHSEGQNDYIELLIKKYDGLKNSVKRNTSLTEKEKQTELKKINQRFFKEKKDSNQKLF